MATAEMTRNDKSRGYDDDELLEFFVQQCNNGEAWGPGVALGLCQFRWPDQTFCLIGAGEGDSGLYSLSDIHHVEGDQTACDLYKAV